MTLSALSRVYDIESRLYYSNDKDDGESFGLYRLFRKRKKKRPKKEAVEDRALAEQLQHTEDDAAIQMKRRRELQERPKQIR